MGKKQTHNPVTVTKKLRAEVFYRDHYRCQYPGCDHQDLSGKTLEVHHVDHDKTNNFRSNLITFCHACNQKESGEHKKAKNRVRKIQGKMDYWKNKKQQLLTEEPNGEDPRAIA